MPFFVNDSHMLTSVVRQRTLCQRLLCTDGCCALTTVMLHCLLCADDCSAPTAVVRHCMLCAADYCTLTTVMRHCLLCANLCCAPTVNDHICKFFNVVNIKLSTKLTRPTGDTTCVRLIGNLIAI